MTRGANRKTRGPGRRLLEIGKDLLIAALVLVNLTLAIMCLPSKTLTQTKWLAGALRPFAGLFGLNEAELTYTAPATGSTIVGAAQPLIITLSTEAGRQSAQYDFAALDELYGQYGSLLAQALESAIARMNATIGLLENMRDTMGSAADKLEAGSADVQAERAEIKRLADEAQQSAATMRDEFDANLKPGLQKLADEASSLVASVGSGLEGLRAAGSGLSDSAGSAAAVLGGAAEKIDATVGELHSASATLRDLADGIDQALVAGDADLLREVLGSDTQVL